MILVRIFFTKKAAKPKSSAALQKTNKIRIICDNPCPIISPQY